MMPSNGFPTPKGVGGPTPPLVSRGSEEEWEMKIPTGGSPYWRGEGAQRLPPGVIYPPSLSRGRLLVLLPIPDEPPSSPCRGRRLPPPGGGVNEPPPTREGRGKEGGGETGSQQNRPKKSTRRAHTSRELRMLDHSDKPPPKRVRRPTRGMDMENSCEVTRESNMICPITCRCHNSLLDIREKTRVVSQILRSTRKIWKNELIAIFGLTSAITNKDEISELKQAQEKRNSDLYRCGNG